MAYRNRGAALQMNITDCRMVRSKVFQLSNATQNTPGTGLLLGRAGVLVTPTDLQLFLCNVTLYRN